VDRLVVIRRIPLVAVGSPNCGEPTTVLMFEYVTRLNTLVAESCQLSESRFLSGNCRVMLALRDEVPGPRIEFRCALPHVPGAGGANAAGLT
jgi:hypothetical protein